MEHVFDGIGIYHVMRLRDGDLGAKSTHEVLKLTSCHSSSLFDVKYPKRLLPLVLLLHMGISHA